MSTVRRIAALQFRYLMWAEGLQLYAGILLGLVGVGMTALTRPHIPNDPPTIPFPRTEPRW
jgi:hypothetical protein